MEENAGSSLMEILTFVLAGETYGVCVGNIKEVLGVPRITRVPRMPEFMNGVINLRGNVIPVLDLRMKFGLGKTEMTKETNVIVTEISDASDDEGGSYTIGIFSDEVLEVVTLERDEILPPPKIGVAIDTEFIVGMGKSGNDFIIILDIDRLLSVRELTGSEVLPIGEANA